MAFTTSIKSGLRNVYNRTNYNWLIVRKIKGWLVQYASHEQNTIVDFGCGRASYREFLNFKRYIGLDIARWPGLSADVEFYELGACDLKSLFESLKTERQVVLMLTQVLMEIPDWRPLLKELISYLQPGWRIVITEPLYLFIGNNDMQRIHPINLNSYLKELGVVDIEIEYGGYFFMSAAIGLQFSLISGQIATDQKQFVQIHRSKRLLFAPIFLLINYSFSLLDKLFRVQRCPASYLIRGTKT